jgi:ribosomal protein L20
MQAQQVQAQQKQQAMQAMMQQAGPGPVPEGTQFAQAQPSAQGIDDLPVEFGLAGGGIVAFKKGGDEGEEYETRIDKLYRENREDAERPERKKDNEGILKALAFLSAPLAAAGDVVAAPIRGLYGLTQHGGTSMTPLMDARARFLASSENAPASEASAREVAAKKPAPTQAENRGAINASDAASRSAPPAPKPVADLKALAEQKRRQQAPTPVAAAPAPTPVPVEQPRAPAQVSDAAQKIKARLDMDPNAAREAEQARRLKEIGAVDTSTHDRMIAELEKRKAQLEGPQDSYGQLMEYLGQIAATPRGMSSFEAGAAGAANLSKLQKARQLEQFDLSKQALEVSQKKIDTVRAFATEQYNVGKARFDQVYKEEFEAAKALVTDEREAAKLAQENTLKRLEIDSAERRNAATNATQLQAARISAAARESGKTELTPNQRAEIANKAKDNVQNELKTNMRLLADTRKNPGLVDTMVQRETDRLMAAAEGRTIAPAPGAGSPGGTTRMRFDAQGNPIK